MTSLNTQDFEIYIEAIRELAAHCDGAVEEDGIGFNKPDAQWGNFLAAVPVDEWTEKDAIEANYRLRKYKEQLLAYGVDYSSLPLPVANGSDLPRAESLPHYKVRHAQAIERTLKQAMYSNCSVDFGDDLFIVDLEFKATDAREKLKDIWGRRWNNDTKCWTLPAKAAASVETWAAEFGIELTEAAKVAAAANRDFVAPPPPEKQPNSIKVVGDVAVFTFEYDPNLVAAVKNIAGRKWDKENKKWTCPLNLKTREAISVFVTHYGEKFEVDAALTEQFEAIEVRATSRIEASQAHDCNIEIEGLGGELRPFQKAGVSYMIDTKRTFLADDMGLGKTVQALAALQAADAFPAVIICPVTLKYNWAREAKKWLPGKTVTVVDKKVAANMFSDIIIINYDILCRNRKKGDPKKKKGEVTLTDNANIILATKPKALVLDESHYVKSNTAARTKACALLAKETEYIYCLTGTPVQNRPKELVAQLQILNRLEEFGGFWPFISRYCGAYRGSFGIEYGKPNHIEELNQMLRGTCFIRREKSEVLPELPAKTRTTLDIPMENPAVYAVAAADACKWMAERKSENQEFRDSIAHLPTEERRRAVSNFKAETEYKSKQAEQLVRIETLKQVAAEQKLPAVITWVTDFLESGQKLVLFADHISIQKALCDAFPGCVRVLGEDTLPERQAAVDAFQEDEDVQLMVSSLKAGGVGLTLTAASNVAFMELGWNPAVHDQAEDRCHRIGQHDNVTAWYLLAQGTIDDDIWELIEAKRDVTNAVTATILPEIIARLAAQAA